MEQKINTYGKVAVLTYNKIKNQNITLEEKDITNLWKETCRELELTESTTNKGCPKNAFIGVLRLLPLNINWKDKEIKKESNICYSQKAIEILKNNKNKEYSNKELWKEVLKELNIESKKHNGQMDVVLALWDYIK